VEFTLTEQKSLKQCTLNFTKKVLPHAKKENKPESSDAACLDADAGLGMGLNWLKMALTFLAGTKTNPELWPEQHFLGDDPVMVELAAVTTGCLTLNTDAPP
jgi:hypothetical protein